MATTMKLGLQTSTSGVPIGMKTLAALKTFGFTMPRIEAGPDPAAAAAEVLGVGMQPLVICFKVDQMRQLPPHVDVELGNEPDLETNGWTLESYTAALREAIAIARERNLRLWLGAVSNLNPRGFRFLSRLPWEEIPPDVGCSIHRYPDARSGPTAPHVGDSRDDEISRLKEIVGERPLGVSEVGYNSIDFQEPDIPAHYTFEREFFARHGFAFAIAYQITDGPTEERLNRYGFRRVDGGWKKPLVEAWSGQPFQDPPPTIPPVPRERTYNLPVDVQDGAVRISGTLTVTVRVDQNAAHGPPVTVPIVGLPVNPTPLRDLHLWVIDSVTSRGVANARVTSASQESRTTSGEGHTHFPVRGAARYHVEAQAYVPRDIELGPGEHRVPIERRVPARPRRDGAVRLNHRTLQDAAGPYLGLGFSFFWAARAFRDHRERYERNMTWAARHAFSYYRNFVLTGGWPGRDPWRDAGAFLPWALDVLPQVLDDAWTRFGLRCSLTIFDGFPQTPTLAEQTALVRQVCDLVRPRLHTLNDLQIANEYGPCKWDFPEGIGWLRAHARLARSLLGPNLPLSLSSRNAVMNDERDEEKTVAEGRALFDGLLDGVVTVSVNHDSRETGLIDGPWRHVRQGWERVLHDRQGKALEPEASIDDEPMGPRSSVAEETNVSRLVSKAVNDFVAGRCAYTYHADAGIWSNLLNPPQRGMGEFALVEDHPASEPFAQAMTRLLALLPPDLPNWSRTRHGIDNHPFSQSFTRQGEGFTQIWPDGTTRHGVVRAYCALRGNDFVCPLTGIRDRIDLRWDRAIDARLLACATGDEVGTIARGDRSRTVPQSVDTDVVIVGKFV